MLRLSKHIHSIPIAKIMPCLNLPEIDLLVCDMAGTIINEGGMVYETLYSSMRQSGFQLDISEMRPWYGAKKESVIKHFARLEGIYQPNQLEQTVHDISDIFLQDIRAAYSAPGGCSLIDPELPQYFDFLRSNGIKIGLDTGYPPEIQDLLISVLDLEPMIDAKVSSYDVSNGRPYPFMIFHLMETLGIMDVKRVAKVGDSVRDIEEGIHAGCGLVVGVTSGADSAASLLEAGADMVCAKVTDIDI